MNQTHWEHAGIAAVMQFFLICVFCVSPCVNMSMVILTALPPLFYFFSREHAQQEKKLQQRYNDPAITWSITVEALFFWNWSLDAKLDFAFPLVVCILQTALAICWLM